MSMLINFLFKTKVSDAAGATKIFKKISMINSNTVRMVLTLNLKFCVSLQKMVSKYQSFLLNITLDHLKKEKNLELLRMDFIS